MKKQKFLAYNLNPLVNKVIIFPQKSKRILRKVKHKNL